ncbi:hypothetical protein [Massilia aquatica]|uniref:Lipoprotein n=1 Tax=Massilia aquatica TaxID=2609000 RepID=A0ABX0M9C6_9BURK|nr:hypothetical protein [Massilia aquatica]NHZ43768.1 hypothetical protein [Massilia aquatica]
MNKMTTLISAVLICFCFTSCGIKDDNLPVDKRTAVFCHVPFDVATSTGMKISNFPRSCAYVGELSVQDRKYLEILKLIKKAKPGPFLDLGVRVTITVPDSDIIYIDDDGGVIMGATQVRMDRYGFAQVKRIVRKLAKKNAPSLPSLYWSADE